MRALITFLCLICFIACNHEKTPLPIPPPAAPQVSSSHFEKSEGDCSKSCVVFEADVPTVIPAGTPLSDSVQHWVENAVCGATFGDEEPPRHCTVAQCADSLLQWWRQDRPTPLMDYTIQISDTILALQPRYLSLELDAYLDTGGLHSNLITTQATFDATTGKRITRSMVIRDEQAVCKQLEAIYRAEKKEAFDEGFEFEGGKIAFPQNFALTPKGIVFHYNTYEVADYARGDFQTLLTWSELGAAAVNPYP